MSHKPLSKLLIEVNKIAMESSAETLRESVTDQLVHVYRRVGADALFYPGIFAIQPTMYQSVNLPEELIKVIDVRTGYPVEADRGITGNMNRYGQMVCGTRFTRYEISAGKIWFHDNRLTAPLTVTYWQVPTDREGSPLIDDRIWQAAVLYCQSEVARVGLHSRNKQSFSAVPYQVDKQAAATEMDAARADCNELADPDFVKLYNALHPAKNSFPVLEYSGTLTNIY